MSHVNEKCRTWMSVARGAERTYASIIRDRQRRRFDRHAACPLSTRCSTALNPASANLAGPAPSIAREVRSQDEEIACCERRAGRSRRG